MVPAKKPGKNKTKPERFRPVSLTCSLGKVLETGIKGDMCTISTNWMSWTSYRVTKTHIYGHSQAVKLLLTGIEI